MAEKLRFAPLIRVSTEKQEERGSSLATQKESILKAVSNIGGYVPDECWDYSGQEHATPDSERKIFNELLADASKDIFDAVIVYDPSRWSRDNRMSKNGLDVLKKNGIRFFSGTTEYDLYNPQATLFLGMSTEMNEYFALEQARKSLLSRIARAKNNIPSAGKLPYGRTFDRKANKWGIDKEKQDKIIWASEQYLLGKSMGEVAETLGMNHPNLWKILKKRSGSDWEIVFDNKRLNVFEIVTLKIPELLPQETIDAIHAKAESNKTYEHGHIKNKYLLSRMIFCARCGYAMFGQTNHSKTSYYRHSRNLRKSCDMGLYISAAEIEQAVFLQLYSLSGDSIAIENSMKSSVDKYGDYQKLNDQVSLLESQIKSIATKKNNIVNAIADGIIGSSDAKAKMDSLKEQELKLKKIISTNKKKIQNIPSPSEIKKRSKFVQEVLKRATKSHFSRGAHFLKMSWEDRRELCELLFSGVDLDGNRAGVYIDKDEDGNWQYEVRGLIDNNIVGQLPMSKHEIMDLLKIDPDDFELQQDLFSKRDAHNGLCLY